MPYVKDIIDIPQLVKYLEETQADDSTSASFVLSGSFFPMWKQKWVYFILMCHKFNWILTLLPLSMQFVKIKMSSFIKATSSKGAFSSSHEEWSDVAQNCSRQVEKLVQYQFFLLHHHSLLAKVCQGNVQDDVSGQKCSQLWPSQVAIKRQRMFAIFF